MGAGSRRGHPGAVARGCGTGQGHAVVHGDARPPPAAGRGQNWLRAGGAGLRGLEVLMLLISIDFPGSSAYRWLRLGRPEGQLGSAGTAGKRLAQQSCLRCLRRLLPAARALSRLWAGTVQRRGTGTPTAPHTLSRSRGFLGQLQGRCPRPSASTGGCAAAAGLGTRGKQAAGGKQWAAVGFGCSGGTWAVARPGVLRVVLDAPEMLGARWQAAGSRPRQRWGAPPGAVLTVKTALRLLSSSMSWGTPVLAQRIT